MDQGNSGIGNGIGYQNVKNSDNYVAIYQNNGTAPASQAYQHHQQQQLQLSLNTTGAAENSTWSASAKSKRTHTEYHDVGMDDRETELTTVMKRARLSLPDKSRAQIEPETMSISDNDIDEEDIQDHLGTKESDDSGSTQQVNNQTSISSVNLSTTSAMTLFKHHLPLPDRPTDMMIGLFSRPPIRDLVPRKTKYAKTAGGTRAGREATYGQAVGVAAPVPCTACSQGYGCWKTCVALDEFKGACANCYRGKRGHLCSFRADWDRAAAAFASQTFTLVGKMGMTPFPTDIAPDIVNSRFKSSLLTYGERLQLQPTFEFQRERNSGGLIMCALGCGGSFPTATLAKRHERTHCQRKQVLPMGMNEAGEHICRLGCDMTFANSDAEDTHRRHCDKQRYHELEGVRCGRCFIWYPDEESLDATHRGSRKLCTVPVAPCPSPLNTNLPYPVWKEKYIVAVDKSASSVAWEDLQYKIDVSDMELEWLCLAKSNIEQRDQTAEIDDSHGAPFFFRYRDRLPGLTYLGESIRTKAEAFMKEHNIAAFPYEGKKCPGFSWRHGYVSCVKQCIMSIDNTTTQPSSTYFQVRCYDCYIETTRIARWITQFRYDSQGTRLCAKCDGEALFGSSCCKNHQVGGYRVPTHIDKFIAVSQNQSRNSWGKAGFRIRNNEGLEDFLRQTPKIQVDKMWKPIVDAFHFDTEPTAPFFFWDTEFGCVGKGEGEILFEISIFNWRGEKVLDTTVDYGGHKVLSNLNHLSLKRFSSTVARVYGKSGPHPSERRGKTLVDIAKEMAEIGITQDSLMIEWSVNGIDLRVVKNALSSFKDIILPKFTISPLRQWQKLIPGFPTFALELAYPIFFPNSKLKNHHRASVDTMKLIEMTKKLCDYIEPAQGQSLGHGLQSIQVTHEASPNIRSLLSLSPDAHSNTTPGDLSTTAISVPNLKHSESTSTVRKSKGKLSSLGPMSTQSFKDSESTSTVRKSKGKVSSLRQTSIHNFFTRSI